MKLPRRGMLIDKEGKVKWIWARNGFPPEWEHDSVAPVSHNVVTGEVIASAEPGDAVIDLEPITTPRDMSALHDTHKQLLWRKDAAGEWEVMHNIADMDEAPEYEHHPLQRRILKQRALHKEKQ